MSKSSIEWTESTWNPIVGCSKVSAGCKNCYAERMACRIASMEQKRWDDEHDGEPSLSDKCHVGPYDTVCDLSVRKWNGKTVFVESALSIPLKRKKATTYFVCSMSDLFHPSVPDEWIFKVFAVMAKAGWHTYQVLTKRPERMPDILQKLGAKCDGYGRLIWKYGQAVEYAPGIVPYGGGQCEWPLRNVWLGTTAENQEMADERIPELLKCPAAKHFVSIEPMLSEVKYIDYVIAQCTNCNQKSLVNRDIQEGRPKDFMAACFKCMEHRNIISRIDWVICGGESGPGARPMHPDWARGVRDQCKAAGVPFFFKQHGEYIYREYEGGEWLPDRVGKKKAGCLLDGVEHKEYPK